MTGSRHTAMTKSAHRPTMAVGTTGQVIDPRPLADVSGAIGASTLAGYHAIFGLRGDPGTIAVSRFQVRTMSWGSRSEISMRGR